MSPSRNHNPNGLKVAVTVTFVLTIMFQPPISVRGFGLSSNSESLQKGKMVLGSRPPGCVNKCLSCRPCMATLVVPSHQRKASTALKTSYHGDEEDSYYLLSWKCRCGDKLFQP